MLASRTSRWSAGTVLLSVVLLAAAWFLLIAPKRADAGDLRSQTATVQSQAATLTTTIAQLKAEFSTLPQRKAQLAAVKEQLPPSADMPDLVRHLQSYASDAGVSLDSLTPGSPSVYGQTAGTTTGTPAAGTVVQIPLAIAVTGDYFEDSLFVKYLQTKLTRAALISNVTVATSQNGATVSDSTSATPTASSTSSSSGSSSTAVSLTLAADVFVMLDGTSSLSDVTAQTKAATGTTSTTTATPTVSSTAKTS